MKSRLLLILFFFVLQSKVFSQDFASMFSISLKGKDISTFYTLSKNNNESTLFMVDKNKVYANKLDVRMQLKDTFSSTKPEEDYKKMIGAIETENVVTLFWSSEDFTSILAQSFNFKEHNVALESIPYDAASEKLIHFFSENQKFYILSSSKKFNELKLTVIDENKISTEKRINISELSSNAIKNLKSLELNETSENSISAEKIDSNSYTFYTESAKKNKCYSNGKNIFLTFDSDKEASLLITIDLNSFSITEKKIEKPILSNNQELKSNSFLIDDKLLLVCFNTKDIIISVKDFNNNLLKQFSSLTNDFNAVEYITEREIGVSNAHTKREKFLKSLNDEFGISCYKVNNTYQISIGKPETLILPEEQRNFYATIGGGMGGFIGALIGSLIDYSNSTKKNFTSFMSNGRSYFNYTINDSFIHINNRHDQIAAEKLRYFLRESNPGIGQIFYKVDNINYFGYYSNTEKRYFIRKFID